MMPARVGSKFRPEVRAETTAGLVRSRPERGRKPWLARVFIMGQGPRTGSVSRSEDSGGKVLYSRPAREGATRASWLAGRSPVLS